MINTPFYLKLVVAPSNGYYLTEHTKSRLYDYLCNVGMSYPEITLEIIDPEYVTVNLTIGVRSTYSKESDLLNVYSDVSEAANNYFSIGNIKIGSRLSSDYISTVIAKSNDSIVYVDILNFREYQLKPTELPILGEVNILFNYETRYVTDNVDTLDANEHYHLIVTNDPTEISDSCKYIEPNVVDDIDTSDLHEYQYLLQEDSEVVNDVIMIFNDQYSVNVSTYGMSAVSSVRTDYTRSTITDDSEFNTDLSSSQAGSTITDIPQSFDYNINY